jgi:hypothetical protein
VSGFSPCILFSRAQPQIPPFAAASRDRHYIKHGEVGAPANSFSAPCSLIPYPCRSDVFLEQLGRGIGDNAFADQHAVYCSGLASGQIPNIGGASFKTFIFLTVLG